MAQKIDINGPTGCESDSSDSSSSSSSDDDSSSDDSDSSDNETSKESQVNVRKKERRSSGMGASGRSQRSADHPDTKGVRAAR